MNAFNTVDLAGACILTSTEYAEQLGISKDRWIYPLGGAGTRDSYDCKFKLEILTLDGSLIAPWCSLGATELL